MRGDVKHVPFEFKPCPECKEEEKLLLSTPVNERNGIVEDAGVVCLSCNYKGPRVKLFVGLRKLKKLEGLVERMIEKWNNDPIRDERVT